MKLTIREEKLRRILFEFYIDGCNNCEEVLEKRKIESVLEELKGKI